MKKIFTFVLLLLFTIPSFAQWDSVSVMPMPVKGAKAIVQDTIIYIFGGYSDSAFAGTKKIQAYLPESNQWRVLKDTITVPRWGLSAVSYGDSAYIFGGAKTSNDSSYSIEGWGYENKSNIRWYNPNFNRSFSAASIVNEFLYIFGGYPADFELYDSLSYLVRFNLLNSNVIDSFSINDSFAVDLPSHQMTAVKNNRIYIFGGVFTRILRNISYLDLNDFSWNELDKKLTKPLAGGVALALPNSPEILLIGGKNEESEALRYVDGFDTIIREIFPKQSLNFARSEHTAVIYKDSLIFVFGGRNSAGKAVSQVEKIGIAALIAVTSISPEKAVILNRDFELLGNYPNPFNPQTTIAVNVNDRQYFSINIYDIQGRKIKTLYNNILNRGRHEITWDAKDDLDQNVTSGIYFYTVSSGNITKTNRMLLIK